MTRVIRSGDESHIGLFTIKQAINRTTETRRHREKPNITREQGADRVLKTLQTLWALRQGPDEKGVSGHKGFFYHFLNLDDAKRYKNVELSSIDTGLLMAGVLSCMSYFNDETNETEKQIRNLAEIVYI